MKIGDLEIYLLSDGVAKTDAGGPFGLVPKSYYESYIKSDNQNRIAMALTCMLIFSEGKTILVDTGLGAKLSAKENEFWGLERPNGGLVRQLASKDIQPQDIDIVVNTHLHADHCGGNTIQSGDTIKATFPNATYMVQRMEWAQASHPNSRTRGTYFEKNFATLVASGQMKLLHGDTEVTKEVKCVMTPGHTRGHQSLVLQSRDWKAIFLADLASYSVHMQRTSWTASYDVYPLQTIETKQKWQRWVLSNDALMFFQHDPQIQIARLRKKDGRLIIRPE
ncbi:MAG: MBL fold metallo-hydrolase [Chloroflexi bacterium]|nr:MBL fold metallo-hydrolase [Chloroflexota bacterium]